MTQDVVAALAEQERDLREQIAAEIEALPADSPSRFRTAAAQVARGGLSW